MNNRFPKNGSFTEQKHYVDSLPTTTQLNELDQAIEVVRSSSSSFNVDRKSLPQKVELEVFHHALSSIEAGICIYK